MNSIVSVSFLPINVAVPTFSNTYLNSSSAAAATSLTEESECAYACSIDLLLATTATVPEFTTVFVTAFASNEAQIAPSSPYLNSITEALPSATIIATVSLITSSVLPAKPTASQVFQPTTASVSKIFLTFISAKTFWAYHTNTRQRAGHELHHSYRDFC